MIEKITTQEEYQQSLIDKKKYRDELFNLKVEMFMNKNDTEKVKLLEDKHKLIKSKYAKLAFKIKEYEIENNIEVKKEGKKK